MTAKELEAWLDDPQSRKAGTGVGIESGHRIIQILRKNPGKTPDGYDEVRFWSDEISDVQPTQVLNIPEQEDIAHMRKVVR